MLEAVPNIEAPGEYEKINFIKSPFVELIDGDDFDVKMQYPLCGIANAISKCLVREEVYQKLLEAKRMLPEGINFRIWDAWRPFALQAELYNVYSKDIFKRFDLDTKTEKERRRIIAQYISEPKKSRNYPPVHTTGGAVDITLVDSLGNELDMGTCFDSFTETAQTNYFEADSNSIVKKNRRLLYNVMNSVGFTNLPSEWWHYDYGDRFWAFYKQTPALYEGVFEVEEVN